MVEGKSLVDVQDDDGKTVLMIVIEEGCLDVIMTLVETCYANLLLVDKVISKHIPSSFIVSYDTLLVGNRLVRQHWNMLHTVL